MPCRDPLTDHEVQAASLRNKLDRVTDLLCEACSVIEVNGMDGDCSAELKQWAAEHTQADIQNVQRQIQMLTGAELRKVVKFLDSL